MIVLNYKKSIHLIFYNDVALDLPKRLQCLVDKRLSCLENIYLEVVAQSSLMKKVFFKTLQNFENTCAGVSFLMKLQAGSLQLY